MALYTWLIALYTMFSSIYHVHCSIYHVHCSIYMVHCSIYHVFLEKNEFAKLCITSGIRTHDLMQTARPRWPLHHERWYRIVFVHGISMFDSALRGVRHLAAGVGHPARGPPRHPLRPWRHRHGPSSSLRFPGPGLRSPGTQAPGPAVGHWTRSWSCHQCLRSGPVPCEFRVRQQAQAF